MNYYLEITLLPDAEVGLSFIWQKVFQQIHIAFAENKIGENQSAVAVGFPDYHQAKFPLGNKLRLFAKDQAMLEQLEIPKWLARLEDYAHIKGIKPVPSNASYVSFVRKRVKSKERIERDMQQKAVLWSEQSDKPLVECLAELEKTKPNKHCSLPFVYLYSQETKQRSPDRNCKFPLFIEMKEADTEQIGHFDCYGLAKLDGQNCLGTVPQF